MKQTDPIRRRFLTLTLAVAGTVTAGTGALVTPAHAHGPTPQKIDESIVIAAPPAKVWAVIGDFANVQAWNPWASASVADKGNTAGSKRTVTRAEGGGEITEELDEIQPEQMVMSYRSGRTIDAAVLPASSYSVRIQVLPEGDGSKVEFRGRAYRADTGNEAPKGRDDKAVVTAMKAYIVPGLQKLKTSLE